MTEPRKKELLNCPFCDGEPARSGDLSFYSSGIDGDYDDVEVIECSLCEARNDECFWNKRPKPKED